MRENISCVCINKFNFKNNSQEERISKLSIQNYKQRNSQREDIKLL